MENITLNTEPTRRDVLAVIATADLDSEFTDAGIDPDAAATVLDKLLKSVAPKPKTGDSATKRRNERIFTERVSPFLAQHPDGVTAAMVAECVNGLPVGASGKVTTQAAATILRTGVGMGGASVLDKSAAKAWHKAHKGSGNGFVYIPA